MNCCLLGEQYLCIVAVENDDAKMSWNVQLLLKLFRDEFYNVPNGIAYLLLIILLLIINIAHKIVLLLFTTCW